MFILITGTEQHEHAKKHSVICTGVVALGSPAAIGLLIAT